jgi:hypothetical protein
MKAKLLLLILMTIFAGCEKTGPLSVSEVIPGGCAVNKGESTKSIEANEDEVSYSFVDGDLDFFVGFNATCCSTYHTSSQIQGDSILIRINISEPGMCNCICYYTYDFKFKGTGENYKYKVTVDDYLTFTGIVNP